MNEYAPVHPISGRLAAQLCARKRTISMTRAGGTAGLMIGYAPLPFFAKNLLIFAFVGSRTRRWVSLHGWYWSGHEYRAQRVD